jgi:hypothetical protein
VAGLMRSPSRALTGVLIGTEQSLPSFRLSGIVLARSLDRDPDPIGFFRNRLFRSFPAAIAVVALLTILHWQFRINIGYEASFDPADVILNMLMMRSDINGVMWSKFAGGRKVYASQSIADRFQQYSLTLPPSSNVRRGKGNYR